MVIEELDVSLAFESHPFMGMFCCLIARLSLYFGSFLARQHSWVAGDDTWQDLRQFAFCLFPAAHLLARARSTCKIGLIFNGGHGAKTRAKVAIVGSFYFCRLWVGPYIPLDILASVL